MNFNLLNVQNINCVKNSQIIIGGNNVINGQNVFDDKNCVYKITIEEITDEKIVKYVEHVKTDTFQFTINGDCSHVFTTNAPVNVTGNCTGDIKTSNASVTVGGNVLKNVTTSNGKVDVGGYVGGNVTTSNGNVYHR